jgi:hypothetical protein
MVATLTWKWEHTISNLNIFMYAHSCWEEHNSYISYSAFTAHHRKMTALGGEFMYDIFDTV